ncbi:MAG: hypothetical protein HY723_05220, partial [Chloroflexi bacterium]|nr:hypothetical protein [Chloroflexota bacterium]
MESVPPAGPAPAAGATPAPLHVGRRLVGPGQPVFVIAEIGVNHNGDPDLAFRLVEA